MGVWITRLWFSVLWCVGFVIWGCCVCLLLGFDLCSFVMLFVCGLFGWYCLLLVIAFGWVGGFGSCGFPGVVCGFG